MRLKSGQRLRRNADFCAVREQGRRMDCGAFLLTWRVRPSAGDVPGASRVGVVASRAAVGGAVTRNRAKRRLREIYRKHQVLVPASLDLVLTARAAVLQLSLPEVEQRFTAACRKVAAAIPNRA
jgi:ribonuclease P protein component